MPRSLLLSLVAAITLAACSKQEADTGAAPAPDTAAPEAAAPADAAAIDREAEVWSRSERAPGVIMSPRLALYGVLVNRAQ